MYQAKTYRPAGYLIEAIKEDGTCIRTHVELYSEAVKMKESLQDCAQIDTFRMDWVPRLSKGEKWEWIY